MLVYILQPWNLVFELPFVFAFLYTLLTSVGVGGDSSNAEHDLDLDHDVDVDHNLDHEFEHGIEHVVHDHQLVPVEQHQVGELSRALSFLGVGRIPLSLVITTFLYIFGFVGWSGNMVLGGLGIFPGIFFWISLVVALVCSVFLTRDFAIWLGRLLPKYESFGISNVEELSGSTGEVANHITETFGTAHVRDKFGNLHEVHCRVLPGEESIPYGSRVILMGYDPKKGVFDVVESTDSSEEVF